MPYASRRVKHCFTRRLFYGAEAVKKYYFLTKGLQSAARIICAPAAHKFHTCSLSGIFFAAHVAEENDRTSFRRRGGETLRGF